VPASSVSNQVEGSPIKAVINGKNTCSLPFFSSGPSGAWSVRLEDFDPSVFLPRSISAASLKAIRSVTHLVLARLVESLT